jgi:hypothetical protein
VPQARCPGGGRSTGASRHPPIQTKEITMSTMKLPKQAPGVERNIHKRAVALGAAGNGVRPSGLFDILSSIASKAVPFIRGGLSAMNG